MQTHTGKLGFVGAVKQVIHKDGFRALYTGLSASIFRQMTYSVTRFGVYEQAKEFMSQSGECTCTCTPELTGRQEEARHGRDVDLRKWCGSSWRIGGQPSG